MNLLIKNGRVIDPANKIDKKLDVLIEGERIKSLDSHIMVDDAKIIDASGCIVVPGLIDAHVHLREPGEPEKETVITGSRAAAAGGFTSIICQPNTNPRIDTPEKVQLIQKLSKESIVNLYPSACITKDHKKLVDVRGMKSKGAVKLTDDGDPVIYEGLMYQVLEEAKKNNIIVSPHCELSPWAERRFEIKEYKLEPFFVKRDIEIAKKTDSPLNISHVSMEKSVNEIALAKKKGIPITCEVTPHHFVLTMEAQKSYGSNAKVNPPLRSKYDVTAIIDAISDGTIDIIASDHAPHGVKSKVWDEAEYGIIGLETTLGLVLTKLVIPNIISLSNAIAKMTINPAQIFNLEGGKLTPGMPADITIIDLEKEWKVDVNKFQSKSKNSPFEGWKLKGISTATIVRGKIVMKGGKIL